MAAMLKSVAFPLSPFVGIPSSATPHFDFYFLSRFRPRLRVPPTHTVFEPRNHFGSSPNRIRADITHRHSRYASQFRSQFRSSVRRFDVAKRTSVPSSTRPRDTRSFSSHGLLPARKARRTKDRNAGQRRDERPGTFAGFTRG